MCRARHNSHLNARMHIKGKRDAIDAQSAKPFLIFPANSRVFPHARPLPVKPRTLRSRSALRSLEFLHLCGADPIYVEVHRQVRLCHPWHSHSWLCSKGNWWLPGKNVETPVSRFAGPGHVDLREVLDHVVLALNGPFRNNPDCRNLLQGN